MRAQKPRRSSTRAGPILGLQGERPSEKLAAPTGRHRGPNASSDQYSSLVNGPNGEQVASSPIRTKSRHQRPELVLHRKRAAPNCWSLLVVTMVVLLGTYALVEGKTHHSKRQTASSPTQEAAAQAASTSNQQQLGRDQTNWWNLWWQQYINEAEQPTVRPIVAVSFNGQTIRFPQAQDLDQQQQQQQAPMANLVVPDDDIERTERAADKQQRAARQQSPVATTNQQSNWASVKPTMIRVRQADSSARLNRQVEDGAETVSNAPRMKQRRENDDQTNQIQLVASSPARANQKPASRNFDQYGIQMRSSLNANQQQQQQQQRASDALRIQQQQQQVDDLMNSLFIEQQQQQQHQMSDYEAELDSATLAAGGGIQPASMGDGSDGNLAANQVEGGRPIIDSSSSNMMMPERPRTTASTSTTTTTTNTAATTKQAGRGTATTPGSTTGRSGSVSTTVSTTMRPTTMATSERPAPTTTTTAAPTTTIAATTTTQARGQQMGASSIGSTGSRQGETGETATSRMPAASSSPTMGQTVAQTVAPRTTITTTTTTTAAPQTTRTMQGSTGTTSDEPNMNETPISFGGPNESPTASTPDSEVQMMGVSSAKESGEGAVEQTMGPRQTTPSGRVELQNGRPATSGMMLFSRPQLFGTTTTTTTTTSVPSSSPVAPTTTTTTTSSGVKQQSRQPTTSTSTTSAPELSPTMPNFASTGANAADGSSSSASQGTSASSSTTTTTTTNVTTRRPDSGRESTSSTTEAPAGTANATTDASSESSDDSDEESEDSTAKTDDGSLAPNSAAGNTTAESESTDDDGDEEEGETEGEADQGPANVTAAPASKQTSTTVIMDGKQSSSSSSGATDVTGSRPPTTTQQPMLATMDIERLPKMGTTESRQPQQSSSVTVSSPTLNVMSETTSSVEVSDEEFARVKATTAAPAIGSQAPTANETPVDRPSSGSNGSGSSVLMMTTDASRGTLDSETGITMPMDPMMRMLMMMMNQQQQQSTMQTSTSLGTTVAPSSVSTGSQGGMPAGEFGSTRVDTTIPTTTTARPTSGQSRATDGTSSTPSGVPTTSRKKLQPPPTTQQPSTTANLQLVSSSISPDSPSMGLGRQTQGAPESATTTTTTGNRLDGSTATINTGTASLDDESGGREPKIELLNMDLIPIQRLMTQGMSANQQVDVTQGGSPMQSLGPQPIAPTTTTTTSRAPTVAEVEPGMRLRPIGSGQMQGPTAGSTKQPPRMQTQTTSSLQATSSSRPQAPGIMTVPNQANTVYMIMLPNQEQTNQTLTTTSSAQRTTTSATPMMRQMFTMFQTVSQQDQQQRAKTTAAAATTTPAQTTMTSTTPAAGSRTVSFSASRQPLDRLTDASAAFSNGVQTTTQAMQLPMTTRKSTSGQQLMQTTSREMETQTTSRPRFISQEQFNQTRQQQQQSQKQVTQSGRVTTINPSVMAPTTTTERPSTGLASVTTTREPSESAEPTTTTQTPEASPTTTRPTSTSQAEDQGANTQRPTPPPVAATSRTMTTTTTTTTGPRFVVDTAGERRNETSQMTANLRQPQTQEVATGGGDSSQALQKQVKGKTGLGKSSHSSFIPSKLRTDFSSQRVQAQQQPQQQQNAQQQQQQNEITNSRGASPASKLLDSSAQLSSARQQAAGSGGQAGVSTQLQLASSNNSMPAQSMSAIRQFGGANRMSAMKNAPVAFGRPATMMMTPAGSGGGATKTAKLLGGGRQQQQQEHPTIEFGPAIAVRRPDEPLANGQMPNCTLTGKNFCVITKDYPMNEVRQAVERSFRSVRLMYEELQTVSDQDLQRNEAEASGSENTTQLLTSGHGKFACQTKVEMLRPGWARDEISKEWLVVVNTDVFPQRVRTESCAQPMAPCEFVAPFYDSHCQQRYSLHRFIAVDPQQPSRVTTVLMRFKAGCNCFLKRKM